MTKAALEALELVTEWIHAHRKCPNLQKTLEDEKLECEEKLNSSLKDLSDTKDKMETYELTIGKLKKMCETQLRKNVDLQRKAMMFEELGQRVDEAGKSGSLKECLTIAAANNMTLYYENSEQKEAIAIHQRNFDIAANTVTQLEDNITKLQDDIQILNEENNAQKKRIKSLEDDNERIKTLQDVNKQQSDDIQRLKQEIKTLQQVNRNNLETNDELKGMIKSVQRQLKDVENKLTSRDT